MTSPTGPRTPSLYHFEPAIAGSIIAGTMATFILAALVVPRSAILVTGQLILLVIPVVAALLLHRRTWHRTLGLALPRPHYLLAATLIGLAAWYVNLRLVSLLPIRPTAPHLEQLVEAPPLVEVLVTLALLPPLCEEVLFRGVLTRGLARGQRRGLHAAFAIVVSALAFSLYHLSPLQAVPTFTLGLALAYLTVRADSILPAVLAHTINNAIAITIARDEVPPLTRFLDHNPQIALAGSIALVAGGLAIVTFE